MHGFIARLSAVLGVSALLLTLVAIAPAQAASAAVPDSQRSTTSASAVSDTTRKLTKSDRLLLQQMLQRGGSHVWEGGCQDMTGRCVFFDRRPRSGSSEALWPSWGPCSAGRSRSSAAPSPPCSPTRRTSSSAAAAASAVDLLRPARTTSRTWRSGTPGPMQRSARGEMNIKNMLAFAIVFLALVIAGSVGKGDPLGVTAWIAAAVLAGAGVVIAIALIARRN